ncbi:MAG: CCDC90 family protein [Burkholderiaceae bacterium]|nr:CCDC90 family protein [Burkholderiaceae bacterium]
MPATLARMGSFATALYDALLSAGVASDRAREVVDLFDRSVDERYGLHAQVLATKSDLAELRSATRSDLTEIRTEIVELRAETRSDIAELRAETRNNIAELRSEMKNDIAELRSEMKNGIAELRSDTKTDMATKFDLAELRSETKIRFSNLETRIAETKSELVKWMLAALTAQTALLLALKLV